MEVDSRSIAQLTASLPGGVEPEVIITTWRSVEQEGPKTLANLHRANPGSRVILISSFAAVHPRVADPVRGFVVDLSEDAIARDLLPMVDRLTAELRRFPRFRSRGDGE